LREQLKSMAAGGASYRELLDAREAARGQDVPSPYYGNYQTSDGAIALGCRMPEQRDRACTMLQVADGPEADVRQQLRQTFKAKTTQHWLDVCATHDVPAAPVQLPELIASNSDNAYLMTDVEHPALLHQRQVAPVARMSKAAGDSSRPAAMLGQHTDEILSSLGYTTREIEELRDANVIG
jgi:crotonobetainyl-CoA:carnitine CoA-transferase CaiB-like acyl-CoA transferase